MPRRPIIAALILAASVGAAAPGRAAEPIAAECRQIREPVEREICGEPRLVTAEAAMQIAYSLLRARMPAARRAGLRLDQQVWLRARAASCADKAASSLVHCLLDETEARRHMLAGEGRNGAAAGPALEPAFFREVSRGAYEIEIAYPQLPGAGGPVAAFNAVAHDFILADGKLMAQFRTAAAGSSLASVSYDVIYFDAHLVTVVFWIVSTAPGWTHPFTARESLAFDLSRGRPLSPRDVVLAPDRAVVAIAAQCRSLIEDEARQGGWSLAARGDPLPVVDDFRNWAPGPFALDVLFDPGSLQGYAAGPRTCRLDYGSIAQWLRRGGPLPPK
ncbi:MAG TPA: lysozyme inhibitor LprI family protein [Stellaceae bacterium]|nr:lysozyme inhibitor LprI family protein [Stellaceae bacterium]